MSAVGGFATAGAADLREKIITLTGVDPTAGPSFGWSEVLPCDQCRVVAATVEVLVVEAEAEQRLCHLCLRVLARRKPS